jgi:hypothetical protein
MHQHDHKADMVTEAIIVSVLVGYLDDLVYRWGHHAAAVVADRLRQHYGVLVDKAVRRMVPRTTRRRREVYILDENGRPIRGKDDVG